MATATRSYARLLSTSVVAVALAAGAPTLLGSGGPVHEWTELDFHYLSHPLMLFGILLLISRLVLWAYLAPRLLWRPLIPHRPRRIPVFTMAQRLPADAGWIILISGLLASVRRLPATISTHPGSADLTSATSYLAAFDALSLWVIVLLTPIAIVRAVSEVFPRIGSVAGSPWSRIVALGVAYLLFVDGGVLSAAFDVSGSSVLVTLAVALVLSYLAPILRTVTGTQLPPRPAMLVRGSLLLAEAGWVVALLLAVPALTSAVDTVLAQRYADLESLATYRELLDSLTSWSLAMLAIFGFIRAVGVFSPAPSRILGFPLLYMVLLAGIYALFADNGVLLTAFEVPVRQFMVVLTLALALSYGSSVLANFAKIQPGGLGRSAAMAAPAVRTFVLAVVPAMVVWVFLNHLPVASARLLDYPATHAYGEANLPHFARLFEARYAIAGLCSTAVLAVTLPRALQASGLRYRPLLAATGYGAAACLAWTAGAALSPLGHGYPLAGAVVAAGLFSLALVQLTSYLADSLSPSPADIAKWLYGSRIRGFMLGASLAFYGLLLRPLLYEVLWFAALYEYFMVLLLMLLALLRIGNVVRQDADRPNAPPPSWLGWSHHRQLLQVKADPRSELMSRFQHRFVQDGDWKPLWTYLIGLLYRSQAPLESVRAVGRPLRTCAASSMPTVLPGQQHRARTRRMAALTECLQAAEQALATSAGPLPPLDEEAVRQAAAAYVETGADPETLAAILIAAHCQKGDDLNVVADRLFPLVNTPNPSPHWFRPPWMRAEVQAQDRLRRLRLVDEAVAYFFDSDTRGTALSPSTTA